MLAAISQFYSDQLSIRTAERVDRRVWTGFFSGRAPHGYKNYREGGGGLIRVDQEQAENVSRVFNLYAYLQYFLDSLVTTMQCEGRLYSENHPDFVRSKLYAILTDRSILHRRGEVLERVGGGGTQASDRFRYPRPGAAVIGQQEPHLHGGIESDTYAQKDGELRNRLKRLKMRLDGQVQQKTEIGDTAMKVFELSQDLKNK